MFSIQADVTLIRIILRRYDVSEIEHQAQRFRIYRLNLFSNKFTNISINKDKT